MLTLFRFPYAHSYSPAIHRGFGQQFGLDIDYSITEVPPGHLLDAVQVFRSLGGIGANVTMPHKEEAFAICQQFTERANLAQSVNTLFWRDDVLWGDNTDGIGLVTDLQQNLRQPLYDKVIAILGAGGAARGIIGAIAQASPRKILLCNRNFERAKALQDHFAQYQIHVEAMRFDTLNESTVVQPLDWIINARPSVLEQNELTPYAMRAAMVYELSYSKNNQPLPFATWALAQGAKASFDGLGMLVEQARESFQQWFPGCLPQSAPVILALQAQFALDAYSA